jgi:hypothetical protein
VHGVRHDQRKQEEEQSQEEVASLAVAGGQSFRLYNPLRPFFDKTRRPSEIEPT